MYASNSSFLQYRRQNDRSIQAPISSDGSQSYPFLRSRLTLKETRSKIRPNIYCAWIHWIYYLWDGFLGEVTLNLRVFREKWKVISKFHTIPQQSILITEQTMYVMYVIYVHLYHLYICISDFVFDKMLKQKNLLINFNF